MILSLLCLAIAATLGFFGGFIIIICVVAGIKLIDKLANWIWFKLGD